MADQIRDIEKTLTANARPVAVGIPGYILPMDLSGKLFLHYGHKAKAIAVDPVGAIAVSAGQRLPKRDGRPTRCTGRPGGASVWTVTYDDGAKQAVSYYVTKPAAQAVSDLGHFLTTKQWFTDTSDPFHRAPSAITYDRETNTQVAQDSRVWIAA